MEAALRRFILLTAFCSAHPGPAGAAQDPGIQFREAWGWAVVVPVEVGGAGMHEFLLDTGAAYTILEPSLAKAIGLVGAPAATIVTLAGDRPAAMARVDLALGPATLEDVEVRVAPLPAIRTDEPGVRGLLGQSALKHLEYTIDHARRRLIVHRSEPVQVSPGASRPMLEARLPCSGPAARLVLDSGVSTPILFERGGHRLDLELGGPVRATTNGGSAVWREARLPSFCLGAHRTGPLLVVVRPESSPPREEDGLLPTRFFARVRLGPAGALVAVDFW